MSPNFLRRNLNRLRRVSHLLYPGLYKLRYRNKLILGRNVCFKWLPLIEIWKGATIKIGDNVVLNSKNNAYHVLLHSRVKLIADRKGAIIKIGDNTRIHGSCIHAYEEVSIGQNCLIAANCNIIDSNAHDLSFPHVEIRHTTRGSVSPVIIEDNVWIGTNSIVLPGTHIGYGSVVSAASVVKGDIPPYCLVGGNPAKLIKRYSIDKQVMK